MHGSSRSRIISQYAEPSVSPVLLGMFYRCSTGRGQPTDSFSARMFALKTIPWSKQPIQKDLEKH